MTPRLQVTVTPPLSTSDRKCLSAFIRSLKRDRPSYVENSCSFDYRGSLVTITRKN